MKNNFTPFPVLETERLTLRQLNADDDKALFDYQSNKDNFVHVEMPVYKDIEEAKAYIEKMNGGVAENKWIVWGICSKETAELVGTISIWNLDSKENKGELGYGIFPSHRRRGFMKEALSAVVEFGFVEMRLETIEAYTSHYNQTSIDFLDKMGFGFIETIEDSYSPHGLMDVFMVRNPHYSIKVATEADIKGLETLIQSVLVKSNSSDYPEHVINFMCDYYSEDTILEKFDTKKTWLLESYKEDEDAKLIGTISLCNSEIQALFIDPNAQKGGYGRALLEAAEGFARENGLEKLHLSASLTAKVFYEKMGYSHLQMEDDENFGQAYLMEKNL